MIISVGIIDNQISFEYDKITVQKNYPDNYEFNKNRGYLDKGIDNNTFI